MDAQTVNAHADALEIVRMAMLLPTQGLADGIADGTLFDDIRAIAEELGSDASLFDEAEGRARSEADRLGREGLLHALRQDYTRLFTHPAEPLVPVCESLFLDRARRRASEDADARPPVMYINPVAADASRRYEAAGFARTHGVAPNVAPDHMATELEFMVDLLRLACQDERSGERDRLLQTAREFFAAHPKTWAAEFFSEVEKVAGSEFYRYIAAVANRLAL